MSEATTRAALAAVIRVVLDELGEHDRAEALAALAVLARDRPPQAARRAALKAAEPLLERVSELLEQAADLHEGNREHLEHEAGERTRQPVTA